MVLMTSSCDSVREACRAGRLLVQAGVHSQLPTCTPFVGPRMRERALAFAGAGRYGSEPQRRSCVTLTSEARAGVEMVGALVLVPLHGPRAGAAARFPGPHPHDRDGRGAVRARDRALSPSRPADCPTH